MAAAKVSIERHGARWYIVDRSEADIRVITLGSMSVPKAALKLHDYKVTWAD